MLFAHLLGIVVWVGSGPSEPVRRAGAAPLDGATIAVSVEIVRTGEAGPPLPSSIVAASTTSPKRTFAVESPRHSLTLPAGTWTISCEGPGIWCSEARVDRNQAISLFARKAVVVRGSLRSTPEGEVLAQVNLPAGGTTSPSSTSSLQVRDGRFEVTVPAERHHLRLALRGRAPIYVWDFEPSRQPDRLRDLVTRPGASVVGQIVRPDGSPAAGVPVALLRTSAQSPHDAAGLATSDIRGFFQFHSLPSGRFRLRASSGASRADVGQIELPDDEERDLGILELRLPVAQSIRVTPPTDPGGMPWLVELILRDTEPRSRVATDAEGVVRFKDVPAGPARVRVYSTKGSRYLSTDVDLGQGEELSIDVPLVSILGHLKMGGAGVPGATVSLMSGLGDLVPFETDESGDFRGTLGLPPAGGWMARVTGPGLPFDPILGRLVRLKLPEAAGDSTYEFDIEMGAASIAGSVVDESGVPVPGAFAFVRKADGAEVSGETDSNGAFKVAGLDKGRYQVWPRMGRRVASGVQDVEVTQDEQRTGVVLVLKAAREVTARVVSQNGQPARGAQVFVDYVGQPASSLVRQSDDMGRFSFFPPRGAGMAMFRVFAPDQTTQAACVPLTGEETEIVLDVASAPGGTLRLEDQRGADLEGPPSRIWVEGRGVFNAGDLLGAPLTERTVSGLNRTFTVRGLAPGRYALALDAAPWEVAVQRACMGAPPPDLVWRAVAPGASADLVIPRPRKR